VCLSMNCWSAAGERHTAVVWMDSAMLAITVCKRVHSLAPSPPTGDVAVEGKDRESCRQNLDNHKIDPTAV
jgi:hypothetical protein